MLGNYLKKKFGQEEETAPTDQFYSSLRIGLHTTVKLNLVDLLITETKHQNMVLPSSDMSVLAIGKLTGSQDKSMNLYRFYLKDNADEEFILLISEAKGKIVEATLYKELTVIEPQSDVEWERFLSAIGFDSQEFDEYNYTRVWGNKYTEKADLVEFEEEIILLEGVNRYPSSYMLYSRQIESLTSDSIDEFLLIGVEETENEAKLSFQVGYNILEKDIKVQ